MTEDESMKPEIEEEDTAPAEEELVPEANDEADEEPTVGEIVTGQVKPPAPSVADKLAGLSLGAWAAIAVVALIIGVIIGFFAFGSKAPANEISGSTAVAENKLDSVVATYTLDGKEASVTAQEVLESAGAIEYYKDDEGNYRLPSAEMTISYVRNQILVAEAERRGLSVSDDELAEYAEQQIGTSDFEMLATSYGMSEGSIRGILSTSLLLQKLQDEVMSSDGSDLVMPEEPPAPTTSSEPEEDAGATSDDESQWTDEAVDETADSASADDEDAAAGNGLSAAEAKQYADYIIALAGDEWDAAAGTWASLDGPYASALSMYEITADSASYEAATAAYYVAYQEYALKSAEPAEQWENFTSELFAKATVTLYTLVS